MAKTATEIVERALTLIDEQLVDLAVVASTEMSISDIALEILPTVCRNLVKELPYELKIYLADTATLVEDVHTTGEVQTSYTKQKVSFVAPADFWELVSIRLSVWAKPVISYILVDGEGYGVQNNPFTRGGKQNPVVALSCTTTGTTSRIECFSITDGDAKTVEVFAYIKFSNVPDDVGSTWPDELFDQITKALASELNLIKGRFEESSIKGEETSKSIEQHI